MKPVGHLLNNQPACQVMAQGLLKGHVVVDQVCDTHVFYGTEVPDSIRFFRAQRQLQADAADPAGHSWSLTVPLGSASACRNVCVIKGTLRLPRLQLPDAKTPMNDSDLAEGGRWPLTLFWASPSVVILCHGRRIKGAKFDLPSKILTSYHF